MDCGCIAKKENRIENLILKRIFTILNWLKKIYTIVFALIALCLGFYALVRFAEFNPEELFSFSKQENKVELLGAAKPEKLQQLYDSLENINFVIRREKDERLLKNLKETQANLWERILITRNAISKAEAPKTVKDEESNLIDSLIKGISITAAVLLAIIIFLIVKITRRSKEVEKITERLKSLQTEPVPPPPLGGIDPTLFSTRYRQAPLPQVKPFEQQSETTISPAGTVQTQIARQTQQIRRTVQQTSAQPEGIPLRKTAKQRVTEAVMRMAKALESLRKDGTVKTQISVASDGSKITVPSPNNTRVMPSVSDETTFDRRSREKKEILDLSRRGYTPSEIQRLLSLPRDQIETVIRLDRERGA